MFKNKTVQRRLFLILDILTAFIIILYSFNFIVFTFFSMYSAFENVIDNGAI